MRITDLKNELRDLGAKPEHEARILRAWANLQSLEVGTTRQLAKNFLPLAVRNALPAIQDRLNALVRVHSEHPGADGSARLLLKLQDGQTIESVLLPKDGVCVSTQVGCAVGCVFCMTGKDGLLRQLGSAEIAAQVIYARRHRPLRRVVFMGMGEPSHNIENVLETIQFLGTAGGLGHKNLVFSTVGDYRVFERLPQGEVKPAMALSLHTTRADLRAQLLPRATQIAPAELVELAEDYARKTGHPIQYQWTLIEGINDSLDEMAEVARLLKGKYAMMNMIPFNTVDSLDYRRPSREKAVALSAFLNQQGILTKLRNSAGQDVDGGCGQLRARALHDATGKPIAISRRDFKAGLSPEA